MKKYTKLTFTHVKKSNFSPRSITEYYEPSAAGLVPPARHSPAGNHSLSCNSID